MNTTRRPSSCSAFSFCRTASSRRAFIQEGSQMVVGSFFGNIDIVWMAFAQPRVRHANKLRVLFQLNDCSAAAISHGGPQAADHLVNRLAEVSFVRGSPFDPLGDKLLKIIFDVLKIAVLAPRAHRLQGPHAAIDLVAASFKENLLPPTLINSREESPDHHGIRPRTDSLGNVSGLLDAPVGNDRHFAFLRHAAAIHYPPYLMN